MSESKSPRERADTPSLDQYLSMSTAIGLAPERSRELWLEAKEELAKLKQAVRDSGAGSPLSIPL